MASYTTNTSDKSKSKAIKLCVAGFIGLHAFYVGKIKSGIIHLLLGLFSWGVIITSIQEKYVVGVILGIVLLVVCSLPDLIKLCLGSYRDNVGAPLRE
jgi:restriction system protein